MMFGKIEGFLMKENLIVLKKSLIKLKAKKRYERKKHLAIMEIIDRELVLMEMKIRKMKGEKEIRVRDYL